MTMNYDNYLILGDLNSDISTTCLNYFCDFNNLKKYVKGIIFSKKQLNPPCIDLFVRYCVCCFWELSTLESGISEINKMVLTNIRGHYKNRKAKILQNKNYKILVDKIFKSQLNNK